MAADYGRQCALGNRCTRVAAQPDDRYGVKNLHNALVELLKCNNFICPADYFQSVR